MKEYVHPEMEIDLFEDDCGLLTATSSDCDVPGCYINFSYGEDVDPWFV